MWLYVGVIFLVSHQFQCSVSQLRVDRFPVGFHRLMETLHNRLQPALMNINRQKNLQSQTPQKISIPGKSNLKLDQTLRMAMKRNTSISGLKNPQAKNFDSSYGGFNSGFGNGYGGYHSNHNHGIPYVDTNGCRHFGDFVCFATTDSCSYNTCVYSNDQNFLIQTTGFTTTQAACPVGRGLSSNFCTLNSNNNDNQLLYLALYNHRHDHGHGHGHGHGHSRGHGHLSNPCVLSNTACTGTITTGDEPLPTPKLVDVLQVPVTQPVTEPVTQPVTQVVAAVVPRSTQAAVTLPPQTTAAPTMSTTNYPMYMTQKPISTIRDSGCPDPLLKVSNMHSQGGTPTHRGVNTAEACKRFCMLRPQCRAIDFDYTWSQCYWYTLATQTRVVPIRGSVVDHYLKTSCHQTAGVKHTAIVACLPGYNVKGGSLKRNMNTISKCQIACGLDPNCQGIDFDSSSSSCWLHWDPACPQLNGHATSQHCTKKRCDALYGNWMPYGFSLVSVGYQQKGGVHLSGQHTRTDCLATCLASAECLAVDYKIDDGTCWHIKDGCGQLLAMPRITNYRKQGAACNQASGLYYHLGVYYNGT